MPEVPTLFFLSLNPSRFPHFSQQLLKAARTLKRFPKTDPAALEEQFPDIKYGEVIR